MNSEVDDLQLGSAFIQCSVIFICFDVLYLVHIVPCSIEDCIIGCKTMNNHN
jgi:hypothetical protein